MANIIEFTRGDGVIHTFSIPAANWTPLGKLFFAAKPLIDDDSSDANALIQGKWDDSVVSNIVFNGIAYKRYACYFPPTATDSILSQGAGVIDYIGEFQYVPTTNIPVTFPATDAKLDVRLYFDIKRNTVN